MKLKELVKVTSSEEKAEEFLKEKGILKTFTKCPKCGSERLGKVKRNFYKCYNCKKEFSARKGYFGRDEGKFQEIRLVGQTFYP